MFESYEKLESYQMEELVEAANVFLEVSYRPKNNHIVVDYRDKIYSSVHGKMSTLTKGSMEDFTDRIIEIEEEKDYIFTEVRFTSSLIDADTFHIYGFAYIFDTRSESYSWEPILIVQLSHKTENVHWIVRESCYKFRDRDKFNPEIGKKDSKKEGLNLFISDLINLPKAVNVSLEGMDEIFEFRMFKDGSYKELLSRLLKEEFGHREKALTEEQEDKFIRKNLKTNKDRVLIDRIIESTVWYGKASLSESVLKIQKELSKYNMEELFFYLFKYPQHKKIARELLSDKVKIEEITGIKDSELFKDLMEIESYKRLPDVVCGVKRIYPFTSNTNLIVDLVKSYDRTLNKDKDTRGNGDNILESFRFGLTVDSALEYIDNFKEPELVIRKMISSF